MKITVDLPGTLDLREGDEIVFRVPKSTARFTLRAGESGLRLFENSRLVFEQKGDLCGHGVQHCLRGCKNT